MSFEGLVQNENILVLKTKPSLDTVCKGYVHMLREEGVRGGLS